MVRKIYWSLGAIAALLIGLFLSGHLIIRGVPSSILMTFLLDNQARNAYITGDAVLLHDRLDELGVEEQIKAYYRPGIPDEVELDRFIHQKLYEQTGYVGKAYRVNEQGMLELRGKPSRR